MATKKTTTKATEVKEVKEVKAEAVVEAPKAEAKKAPAKKAATTKTTTTKTTTTKAATTKKAATKKETVITIQHQGNEVTVANVEANVTAAFVAEGHKASEIKTLSIYVKPEEYAAYYVINGEFTGRVYLF